MACAASDNWHPDLSGDAVAFGMRRRNHQWPSCPLKPVDVISGQPAISRIVGDFANQAQIVEAFEALSDLAVFDRNDRQLVFPRLPNVTFTSAGLSPASSLRSLSAASRSTEP